MTTGDETGTMHRYTYAQAGKYIPTLSLVTDKGCKAEIQGDTVAIYPKPSARFTFQPTSPNMDSPFVSFQNLSTGASSFIWEIEPFGKFTSQAPQVEYTDTGYYTATLIAVSTYGCSDTAQTEIYIRNNYRVFLPNAFSPNGDGLNDIFKPIVRGFDKLDFRIYNRWGELIFHTLKDEGWDGTYQGQAVPSGVYSFTLQVLSIYGEMQYFTGEVSVMR
ncbi:MAG: gliding motility-associated C-terminal domain-containing protein [Bacteroidia bacterium]|nr:gliding motility-associated C-terminal domain-containing protein [Bacteroidia bacterium]